MAAPKSREELEREAVAWSGADPDYPTVSGTFNRSQKNKTGLEPLTEHKQSGHDSDFINEAEEKLRQQERVEQRRQNIPVAIKKPTSNKAASLAATAKGTPEMIWLMGIHLWFWATIQLTLGVASLAFLGAAAGLQATLVGRIISSAASTVNAATSLMGLDFSMLRPTNIFLGLHIVLYGFIFLLLLATLFYYAVRGKSPVFGTKTVAKSTAILLVIIGSGVPVANLFPWTIFYILVMWRYPK